MLQVLTARFIIPAAIYCSLRHITALAKTRFSALKLRVKAAHNGQKCGIITLLCRRACLNGAVSVTIQAMSLKENLEHVMKLEGRIAQLEEDNASLNFHIGLLLSCVEPNRNRLAYGTVALRLSPAEARAINSLMARVEIEIKAGNGPSLEEFYKRFENLTPTIDLEDRVDDFVARAVEAFCAEGLRTKVYDYFVNEGMGFTHLA